MKSFTSCHQYSTKSVKEFETFIRRSVLGGKLSDIKSLMDTLRLGVVQEGDRGVEALKPAMKKERVETCDQGHCSVIKINLYYGEDVKMSVVSGDAVGALMHTYGNMVEKMSPGQMIVISYIRVVSFIIIYCNVFQNICKGARLRSVSKYFAGGEGAKEKETGNDATEVNDEENTPEIQTDYALARGRRFFRGNSGA